MELLIILVALLILASISMPAFSRMREKARASQCASNLRMLSTGISNYTYDNGGNLPTGRYSANRPPDQTPDIMWPQLVWSYLYPATPYKGFSGPELPRSMAGTVFECPQAPLDRSQKPSIVNVRSYGMNHYVGDGSERTSENIATISAPESICLIADCMNESQLRPYTLNPRHTGQFNTLYLDGHVSPSALTADFSNLTFHPFWGMYPAK